MVFHLLIASKLNERPENFWTLSFWIIHQIAQAQQGGQEPHDLMEKLKKNVRPFMKLEVTCKAKTYEKLVESFKKENLSEPPFTMSLSVV